MEADGNHVLLNHHWRVCLLNHLTMYDDFQHGNHVLLNHLIIIYNNRKKSFWKLFYVGMLGLLLIRVLCNIFHCIVRELSKWIWNKEVASSCIGGIGSVSLDRAWGLYSTVVCSRSIGGIGFHPRWKRLKIISL